MSFKEKEEEPFEPELSLDTFVESAITETLISDQGTISPKKWTDFLFEIPMDEEEEEDLFNPALNVGVFVNSAGIKTPASEQDTAVSEEWRDFLFEIPMDEEAKGDLFNSEPNVGTMVDSASIETSTSEQDMMAPEKWIDQLLEEAAMTGEEEEELLPFMSTGPSAFVEQSSVGDNLFSFFSPLETKEHAVSKRDSVKSITRNVATMEEFSSKFKTSHKETKQREIEDRRYRLC